VTFVGEPEPVVEAAFKGAEKAKELIDMRVHHGAHPRSGSTDVLPLIPVSGITLEECAVLARKLAERMYKELGIPCYCYEAAAFKPERRTSPCAGRANTRPCPKSGGPGPEAGLRRYVANRRPYPALPTSAPVTS
jgi:Glutamate formiminotransferase